MTEQPAERTILGLSHKIHVCGGLPVAALCGYAPARSEYPKLATPPHFTPTPDEAGYFQDCVVCTELWDNSRASNLHCGRCGERITP